MYQVIVDNILEVPNTQHWKVCLKMMKIEKLVVPAKSSLELKSGGDHVMLMGLKKELKVGDEINLELSFSDGDKKSIKVPVKDLASTMHKMQH